MSKISTHFSHQRYRIISEISQQNSLRLRLNLRNSNSHNSFAQLCMPPGSRWGHGEEDSLHVTQVPPLL